MKYVTVYYNELIIMGGEKKAILKRLLELNESLNSFDINKVRIEDKET